MAASNAYEQYQTQSIMTASPGELTLMLYNGCIRYVKQGIESIKASDIEEANQNIITELMRTLDMQYEISNHMMSLYDYILSRLIDANIAKDVKILEEVLDFVVQLRDTWMHVVKSTRQQRYGNGL